MGKRILVIEDDSHIAEGIKLNLELQGHEVSIAADGVSGLAQWKTYKPNLIVLDIMLPGIDGLTLLQNIRLEDERIPILILSAKSGLDDKVKGLAYGVDDYLSKPFHLEEFLLRAERLMQRAAWSKEDKPLKQGGPLALPRIYKFGNNVIDFDRGTAECQKGVIRLTGQEVKLLKLFISNRGKPLSRDKLLEIGWGYTKQTSTRTVDNFIVRFRKYFEHNPKKPKFFVSLRSVGYRFDHDT